MNKPIVKRAAGSIGRAAVERRLAKVAAERAALAAAKRAATKKANAAKKAEQAAARSAAAKKAAATRAKNKAVTARKTSGKRGLLALGGAGTAALAGKATYDVSTQPKTASAKPKQPKKMTYEPKGFKKSINGMMAPSKSKAYSIKSGDTLSQIAKRQGTTLKALLEANPSITNPNKIRIGQKIKISAPVKGRKSVYQGLSKSQMAGMAVKKRAAGKLVGGAVGRRVASQAVKKATKKFIEKGGKVKKIPTQTRKSTGIQERIPSAAEKKQLRAEIKLINDKIRSLERLTKATGKGGATSGMAKTGTGSTSLVGTGRKPAARVEKRKGGAVMKKQAGGRMSRVGLSPAEMARAGTMSQAKRKRYMSKGGLVKRKHGGQGYDDRKRESIAMRIKKNRTPEQLLASADESYGKFGRGTGKGVINLYGGGAASTAIGKAAARAAVKKATKKFIEKGGKVKKIPEVKPRADYDRPPQTRKRGAKKPGLKKGFSRKTGGVVRKQSGGTLLVASLYD